MGVPPCGQRRAEDRPLIRRGIRRDTFPPGGGRLFGRLKAAPAGSLRPLRRGALCAPAVPMSGPRLCAGTGPRPARPIDAGRGTEAPSSVAAYAVTPSPQEGGRLFGRLKAAPAGSLRPLRRGALCAPAVPMSGPRLCAGTGPRPARPIDAGRGTEAPSSVAAYAVTPSPQEGGRLFGRLKAAPAGSLRPLRRGALCAPAVPMSGPRLCAGTGPRPARPIDAGRWMEDPSSVAAYAATSSPQEGEGFSGGWKPPLRVPFGLCVETGPRPARPIDAGRGKEAPSSVAAYAATPSPQEGGRLLGGCGIRWAPLSRGERLWAAVCRAAAPYTQYRYVSSSVRPTRKSMVTP